ncbi:hypothetical protein BC833DRAFT_594294 [Globomyces pollinis-pini]|nr:hypothetical protein BC833DRAFT_594294 [Globomyces pollinis-pini]KAJ2998262.1 hypothetical protein HDV02_004682 [Globomyces sp. JEL0801]
MNAMPSSTGHQKSIKRLKHQVEKTLKSLNQSQKRLQKAYHLVDRYTLETKEAEMKVECAKKELWNYQQTCDGESGLNSNTFNFMFQLNENSPTRITVDLNPMIDTLDLIMTQVSDEVSHLFDYFTVTAGDNHQNDQTELVEEDVPLIIERNAEADQDDNPVKSYTDEKLKLNGGTISGTSCDHFPTSNEMDEFEMIGDDGDFNEARSSASGSNS